jgi:hypothetical protein
VTRLLTRAGLATLCLLAMAGCVDSAGPILTYSQQAFGPKLRLQLYSLRDGYAHEPEQIRFAWDGKRYTRAGGDLRDVAAVSLHPFEGDNFIVQETPMKRPHIVEYALAHKIADGVYLVLAIDEEDADAATRAALCGKGHKKEPSPCRITTREALFAFARATAARKKQDGALAIRLADTRTR